MWHLDELDVHLTSECNLRCTFCSYAAGRGRTARMPISAFARLVDEAQALGVRDLHLTGGEPTLVENLPEYIAAAVRARLAVRLITNLEVPTYQDLVRYIESGLRSIMISVDGTKLVHQALRHTDRWDDIIAKAKFLKRQGVCTRINSIACNENLEDLPGLVRFLAADQVCDIWSCFLYTPLRGSASRVSVVTPDDWLRFLGDLRALVGALPELRVIAEQGFLRGNPAEQIPGLRGCGAGCAALAAQRSYLIVLPDGATYPCVFFAQYPEWQLGNSLVSDLRSVLHGEAWRLYEDISHLPTECSGCTRAQFCKGGCRGYSLLVGRSALERDPRCGEHMPLCPITKVNLRTGKWGGSSEQALEGTTL
jgi:radical SAM protein with 4Fe4S-binding SPASM domain